MSTPATEAPVAPPLTSAEALADQRQQLVKTLRDLANDCEAGRLPKFVGAWVSLCSDCSELHPATISYTEDQTYNGYFALGGICNMLQEGIATAVRALSFQQLISRARAHHEAQNATRQ